MLLIQLPKSSSGRLASAAFIWQPLVEDVFKFGATPQVLESQWSRPSLDLWSKQEIITVTCYNSCYCILYIYIYARSLHQCRVAPQRNLSRGAHGSAPPRSSPSMVDTQVWQWWVSQSRSRTEENSCNSPQTSIVD